MGGGWCETSGKDIFTPFSLEGLVLEDRDDTRLLGTASVVQLLYLFVEDLCSAFALAIRREQKQGLGMWEVSKDRAALFSIASHHKGIWRYICNIRQLNK